MASIFILPFADIGSGVKPADGAQLFFFAADAVTPKDTFTTVVADVAHANPVIANASGVFPEIWIEGSYIAVLKDKSDVQQWQSQVFESTLTNAQIAERPITKDTIAAAKADDDLANFVGGVVIVSERISGNQGGGTWDVVTGETANGFNIVELDNDPSVQLKLQIQTMVTAKQLGAVEDDSTDDYPVFNQGILLSQSLDVVFWVEQGTYRLSTTLDIVNHAMMKGLALRELVILNFDTGINGLAFPTGSNSTTGNEIENLTIQSSNVFPDASETVGIKINTTAAIRYMNLHNLQVTGFKYGCDGAAPLFMCTLKNVQFLGIVIRDTGNIPGYVEDDSFGMAFGLSTRDATTTTLENVFATGYGKGFYNRRCSNLELINCIAERCYYGVYAEKGMYGTMYQEWNLNSVRVLGTRAPEGVKIIALNQQSSWGSVFADSKLAARSSHLKSINEDREIHIYDTPTAMTITATTQYLEFNQLNDAAITPLTNVVFRGMGQYELTFRLTLSASPVATGAFIAAVQVLDGSFVNMHRAIFNYDSADTVYGSIEVTIPQVMIGPTETFRIGLSRSGGADFALDATSVVFTIRKTG